MTLRLKGQTSGYVELNAPAVAGSNTLTLPDGNGSAGQYLQTSGASGTLSWAGVSGLPAQALTLGTAVASTSGTSVDFTNIPSTVKRITMMLYRISTTGTADPMIQIGTSSGFETSGYESTSSYLNGTSSNASYSGGFGIKVDSLGFANASSSGQVILSLVDASTQKWVITGSMGWYTGAPVFFTMGSKTLGAVLDRIRITTANAFDAGTINIMYEG